MIRGSGTFDYVVCVPDSPMSSGPWHAQTRVVAERTGIDSRDARLVGHSPSMELLDAEPLSDAAREAASRARPPALIQLPRVPLSRITLEATDRTNATVRRFSFHVDRAFTSEWKPGDTVNIRKGGDGSLALSVVRGGTLIAAIGAVSQVPLGTEVQVRVPWNLVDEAEAVFRRHAPDYLQLPDIPLEVRVGSECWIGHGGGQIGGYEFFLVRGFLRDTPGVDHCMALWRMGACSGLAARMSAILIELLPCETQGWLT